MVPLLAQYMRWATQHQAGTGVSRLEAEKVVREVAGERGRRDTIHRAWDRLLELDRLESNTGNDTGRSVWLDKPGDPVRGAAQ